MCELLVSEYEAWTSIEVSRRPLGLLFDRREIAEQIEKNEWSVSETAYLYRMFDLFFPLVDERLLVVLDVEECKAVRCFWNLFTSLPWEPVNTHPHVSQVESWSLLSPLLEPATCLDALLKRRTSMDIGSLIHRVSKGLRVFPPRYRPNK